MLFTRILSKLENCEWISARPLRFLDHAFAFERDFPDVVCNHCLNSPCCFTQNK